jgi:2-(1,2-epoxy-1,2-dihydrophenyl)acetyl-CoA isomerase
VYRDIRVERRGPVVGIEMARPRTLNAWTPDMGVELLAALRDAAADPEARAVLITGAGRAFCSGADLRAPRELRADGEPDLRSRLLEIYNPVLLELRRMPKPAVAAVHGAAAGLGVALALACDLVIAAESAYFLLAFVHVGLAPDGGALASLVPRVGAARAAELAMLGERLPARQAAAWGIVNRVHPDADLQPAAWALAERLAAGPTLALASIKEAVDAAASDGLERQMALDAERQQRHATTDDYREGVAAFKAKRPPRFTGR